MKPADLRAFLRFFATIVVVTGFVMLFRYYEASHPTDTLRPKESADTTATSASALFPFDPNTADSATLLRLGLTPRQVSNMMKYRRKGGRWRNPEHFARLYGLSEEAFTRLRPYIDIAPLPAADATPPSRSQSRNTGSTQRDSLPTMRRYADLKIHGDTLIDLNHTDTVSLKRLPGIGSYRARRIMTYGKQLGGYVSPEQLHDIEQIPDSVIRFFFVTPMETNKLNINTASFSDLVRHPYLSYEQVSALFRYRHLQGDYRQWSEVILTEGFSASDTLRLAPYIVFSDP